jgi:hypothetical protein
MGFDDIYRLSMHGHLDRESDLAIRRSKTNLKGIRREPTWSVCSNDCLGVELDLASLVAGFCRR